MTKTVFTIAISLALLSNVIYAELIWGDGFKTVFWRGAAAGLLFTIMVMAIVSMIITNNNRRR